MCIPPSLSCISNTKATYASVTVTRYIVAPISLSKHFHVPSHEVVGLFWWGRLRFQMIPVLNYTM